MKIEVITEKNELVIRRMILEPKEAMDWHIDPCHRFTVVVTGSKLAIEYRDSGELLTIDVHPGHTGWDDPEPRVHRAINIGKEIYEEIVTFYRDNATTNPQPIHQ